MRKKKTINPLSSYRLSLLCSDKKISQAQLAKLAGVSPNTISNIMREHTAMSDNIANQIVKVFPQIRAQWLTGEDDYKTEKEYQQYVTELNMWKSLVSSDKKIRGLILLLESNLNYQIDEPSESQPNYLLHTTNGNKLSVSEQKFVSLSREISDYAEFRFSRIIGGDTNG